MAFCTSCGATVGDTDKWCTKCGGATGAAAVAPVGVNREGYQASAAPSEPSLVDYFAKCIKTDFTNLNGRARRKEYWGFYLFFCLVNMVPFVGTLAALVLMIPYVAVTVRRLHDIGKSGWWLLGLMGLPFVAVAFMVVAVLIEQYMLLIPCVLFCMGMGILFLVWMCKDGQPGNNQYGPNPKEALTKGGEDTGCIVFK